MTILILFLASYTQNVSARYLTADPIGVTRDYSHPKLQMFVQQRMPIHTGIRVNPVNHLYGYVNQNPVKYVDPYGLDVFISINSNAAFGVGHLGGAVNTANTQGFYPRHGFPIDRGAIREDQPGDGLVVIPTSPEQDIKFDQCMSNLAKNPGIYDVTSRNCATTIGRCIQAAGLSENGSNLPKRQFCKLAKKYGCTGEFCNECN